MNLNTLAGEQLVIAREAASGRSAHTVYGGRNHVLKQTLKALAAGRSLNEHESPGEATLQVLLGRVRLTTATETWEGAASDYRHIPAERHGLTAVEDCVILLTVANRPSS